MDPKDELPARWPDFDFRGMLRRLTDAGVDFVVIGGIAMIIHGSPRATRDLNIVFAPDDANLDALGQALVGLDARLRGVDEDLPFVPDAATLRNIEILTLTTSGGWLDVQRQPPGVSGYQILRRGAERVDVGGFAVLVASPDQLIEMKRSAGRPVDLLDISYLESIKRQR